MFKSKLSTPGEAIPSLLKNWCDQTSRDSGLPFAFNIAGEVIPNSIVSAANGLLPLMCWHADSIYRFAMGGRSLGINFRTSAKALTGFTVDVRRIEKPLSEVMCFMVEAIEDIHKNSPVNTMARGTVDLEGLVNRFKSDLLAAREKTLGPVSPSNREKSLAAGS